MARNKENLNSWAKANYHKRKNDAEYVERRRKSARKYYNTHKDKCKISRRNYFLKNKEAYRKYRREWRYSTAAGIYACISEGVRHNGRGYKLTITRQEFIDWYNSQEKICFYCKRTHIEAQADILNRKINRLTIDRIDNDRGYEKGNLALACLRCNAIKNNYFTQDEMLKIGDIIRAKKS
jgi:hypothetical protein